LFPWAVSGHTIKIRNAWVSVPRLMRGRLVVEMYFV
jgi:hypothetical protein